MGKGTRFEHVASLLAELRPIDGAVLELGCGGAVYKDLFSTYVGIDLLSTTYDNGQSVDVFCDAQALPFQDNVFDLVFTVACFCQIPDSQMVLRGCHRVLKPGGRIAIFDYNKVTTTYLRALYDSQGHGTLCHVWSPENLRDIVSKAGFEAKIVRDSHFWKNSGNPFKEAVKSNVLFKMMTHRLAQQRRGWNIIIGTKAPHCCTAQPPV